MSVLLNFDMTATEGRFGRFRARFAVFCKRMSVSEYVVTEVDTAPYFSGYTHKTWTVRRWGLRLR